MKLKLIILAVYALVLSLPASHAFRSSASDEPAPQTFVPVNLDAVGRRGLVRFNHRLHEALLNGDPRYGHAAPANLACASCHHTVKDVTRREQFQSCDSCHREEGHADNPVPKPARAPEDEGLDLNAREIYHRLCISCHRVEKAKPANAAKNIPVTCGQCHNDQLKAAPSRIAGLVPPPADDAPEEATGGATPAPAGGPVSNPFDPPLGYTGPSTIDRPANQQPPDGAAGDNGVPRPDRWRIGFPDDPRYKRGAWYNPYRQNVLKGDYPIYKQHNFLVLTLESETFTNARRIPVPSNVSSQRPDSAEFFGRGGQIFTRQNFVASVEWFHGDAAFKPIDWRMRFTPVFNINHLNTQENSLVNINPAFGANRLDGYVGFQEMFGEVRLGDTTKLLPFLRGRGSDGRSPYFDSTFIRAGIQQFNSDFRGFIFNDFNLGARLFGQAADNRYNFNLAYFYLLEKDTNSELNTRVNLGEWRDQSVLIANLYRQDTRYKGYTVQFSFHYNNDRPSRHLDENDFPARPALIGDARPHGIKAYYLGFASDGHIGRYNLNHAFYQVFGRDSRNPIAGQRTDLNAQMAAAELSLDRDWLRFKGSFFFASGDAEPFDGTARGFDSIVDLPEFAGGKFSFWNLVPIPFGNTGVLLTSPDSLLPNLRSSKLEGQSNFVNPGIFIYNTGVEAELTPKLRGILNLNYLHFHHTEPLEELLFQPGIRRAIGLDYGVGFIYRPDLSENIVIAGGFSSLLPGSGFKDIFSSNCAVQGCGARPQTLYSAFVKLKFVY